MNSPLLATIVAAALTVVAAPAVPAQGPAVAFDTGGGDAWTFTKRVTGRIRRGACDEVRIESPEATVRAVLREGRFMAEIPLSAGTSRLEALCRRRGADIGRSVPQFWRERLPDAPRAWIRERVGAGRIHLDGGGSTRAPGEPADIVRFEWRARAGNPAPLRLIDGAPLAIGRSTTGASSIAAFAAGRAIDLAVPAADGEYGVTLRVIDALGRIDESSRLFRVTGGKPIEVEPAHHFPPWAQGAIVYGAALPLDGPRALQAVTRRLPAIAALGATVLWLSPITAAPPGDFGYAVTDALHVRADLGTEADLHELVRAAHALGIHVILDMVVNHLSDRHPYAIDARRNGAHSAYHDWFERDAHGGVSHYFDWTHLDNLDYDDPEVQRYMIEAFARWVRADGVDGFRVDASWAVSERAPEFWPRWRAELERIDPDLLLIAEGSATDPAFLAQGFDAAYDWTAKLGEWAWSAAFDRGAAARTAVVDAAAPGRGDRRGGAPDLARLRTALEDTDRPARVLRFLNDNDTGSRFITRHGLAETRLAAAMLLTLPGLPVIYDGDEIGAEFEPYAGRPIVRRERDDLRSLYERLGSLRRAMPALRSGTLRLVATDDDADVLAYVRLAPVGAPDRDAVLVVINWSGADRDVRLASDPVVLTLASGARAADLLRGGTVRLAVAESRPVSASAPSSATAHAAADPRGTVELRVRAHEALVLGPLPRGR